MIDTLQMDQIKALSGDLDKIKQNITKYEVGKNIPFYLRETLFRYLSNYLKNHRVIIKIAEQEQLSKVKFDQIRL